MLFHLSRFRSKKKKTLTGLYPISGTPQCALTTHLGGQAFVKSQTEYFTVGEGKWCGLKLTSSVWKWFGSYPSDAITCYLYIWTGDNRLLTVHNGKHLGRQTNSYLKKGIRCQTELRQHEVQRQCSLEQDTESSPSYQSCYSSALFYISCR